MRDQYKVLLERYQEMPSNEPEEEPEMDMDEEEGNHELIVRYEFVMETDDKVLSKLDRIAAQVGITEGYDGAEIYGAFNPPMRQVYYVSKDVRQLEKLADLIVSQIPDIEFETYIQEA